MSLPRPLAVLLLFSLFGGLAVAQQSETASPDEKAGKASPEKVQEVVDAQAKEEKTDGGPADSDVGEASYNISDCEPTEGEGGESAEGAPESDPDAIDDCENIDK